VTTLGVTPAACIFLSTAFALCLCPPVCVVRADEGVVGPIVVLRYVDKDLMRDIAL